MKDKPLNKKANAFLLSQSEELLSEALKDLRHASNLLAVVTINDIAAAKRIVATINLINKEMRTFLLPRE